MLHFLCIIRRVIVVPLHAISRAVYMLAIVCIAISVMVQAGPPPAPTDIVVKMGDPEDMYVSWTNPEVVGGTLDGFKIEVNRFPSVSALTSPNNITQLLAPVPITIEADINWGMVLGAFPHKYRTNFLVCYQSRPISPVSPYNTRVASRQSLFCRIIKRVHDPVAEQVKLTVSDPQIIPFYNMGTDRMDNDGKYYKKMSLSLKHRSDIDTHIIVNRCLFTRHIKSVILPSGHLSFLQHHRRTSQVQTKTG